MTKKEFLKAMGEAYDMTIENVGPLQSFILATTSGQSELNAIFQRGKISRMDVAKIAYKVIYHMEDSFREHELENSQTNDDQTNG